MKTIHIMILLAFLMINIIIQNAYADTIEIKVSPIEIEFYLEDTQGRKTGITSNDFLQQIPYADQYGADSEAGVENPGPYQKWNRLYTSDSGAYIPSGKYKLVINGNNINKETQVLMRIDAYMNNNSIMAAPGDYIFPGRVNTYEFDLPGQISPTTGQLIVTKVSTPNDLIADINALAKANYIGNAKFVAELIKDIQEIEAERAKGKIDDGMTPAQKAKKEYQEFLKELNEKNIKPEKDEYVDGLAIWILQRDLDYIIGHIQ